VDVEILADREAELAGLEEFLGPGAASVALVFTGGPGIGKDRTVGAPCAAPDNGDLTTRPRSGCSSCQMTAASQ
jgi:hypothetical protein